MMSEADRQHRDEAAHAPGHAHDFLGSRHDENARRTLWVVALTTVMMVAEIAAGLAFGSMALLADGFHMATHAGALAVAAGRTPFGDDAFQEVDIFGMCLGVVKHSFMVQNPEMAGVVEPVLADGCMVDLLEESESRAGKSGCAGAGCSARSTHCGSQRRPGATTTVSSSLHSHRGARVSAISACRQPSVWTGRTGVRWRSRTSGVTTSAAATPPAAVRVARTRISPTRRD